MNDFLENTLTIVNQPKQNFHFRYVSELKSTHGVITGQQQLSVTEDTYPAIRLRLPAGGNTDEMGNNRDFYVLVSLHSYNHNRPHSLSPHLLMGKVKKQENYEFIFQKMNENCDDPLERTWQLKDCVIVRIKTEAFQTSFSEKQKLYAKLQLPMPFDVLRGELNTDDNQSVKASGVLNVCLGFTIFERDFYTNTYRLYKETQYSVNIFHGDNLEIHQLCNTKGPIAGGSKIHLLINLPKGFTYVVRMYKCDNDGNVEWEELITALDIFRHAAITFWLPPGPPNAVTDEVEVLLNVAVDQSTYKSKPVKFCYINNSDEEPPRRRRRLTDDAFVAMPLASAMPPMSPVSPNLPHQIFYDGNDYYVSRDRVSKSPTEHISKQMQQMQLADIPTSIERRIEKILREPQQNIAEKEALVDEKDGNTIFHLGILNMSTLLCLYRELKKSKHKERVTKARNNFRQNLLHYGCVQDNADCIRPLIGMGIALNEQDSRGRTPLHIVIEHKYADGILKFQQLLEDYSQYGDGVKMQLIEMFKIYSHNGHTVLHAAIIEDLPELVEVMLKFCKSNNLDILQYEVLGSGDSVVHLVAKRNLMGMVNLIKEHVPSYLNIKNYPGETVMDLKDLTPEMSETLLAK